MRHRYSLIIGGFTLFLCQAVLSSAFAAAVCYEDQVLPPGLVCDNDNSKSADFSYGCKYLPERTVQVEVPCLQRWVNIVDKKESHSQACARVDLKPANIEGSTCASGELRPSTGSNWEGINYRFGRWGGLDYFGGYKIIFKRDWTDRGGKDEPDRFYEGGYYCYEGGKQDSDNTDRVVAYACGP
ncbi:hypothetical protein [Rhizobium sp. MHM7A]|uniref:hypothetical protein n=1 Tax=Rhizobium sp. MHM7A TaxID=2583233 RepID=UPI001106B96C|nr:hypothetical protein [Rhizobium sp. MHM7A]TLX15766.1 hypothetical protein FFR93_00160 [Rhizobium sp. MHM7A]